MLILPRSANTRKPNSLMIVLAVEGEHTEEQYFKPLRDGKIDLEILSTENGFSAPQHIEKRMDSFLATNRGLEGGEFWLVLDVDRHHALQEVCQRARQKGYHLAVSNPCFELWLWLHLEEVDINQKTCSQLEMALKTRLGGYNKSNLPVEDFHPYMETAIRRAKALPGSHTTPIPIFPGTQIYQLMERILLS
ncbi:RloB family protein [Armatimonas sp.]|uniref:RloB family protein n=1 Tax=Armatimonas sp. TaxID=1872638 RepID=UPI003752D3BD